MGDGSDYPSPRSEGPNGALAASILASASESTPPIARMNDPQQPMSYNLDGARPRLSVRRARDPPKNSEGQIFCDHPECQAAPPTFRRPCEWNKHMDKHDRPYKCYEPNCDKIQGFTYSGGLLRHQREVHKKNTDTKKALMCPYTDCNRSTGNGFTRQENLREHLRRRHMHNDEAPPMVDMSWDRATELDGVEGVRAPSLPITGMKRRHDSPPVGDLRDMPETDEHGIDLHNEVKRLRREVQEKDRRLEELERIVANIQQAIPQQSPPGPELQDLSQPAPQPTAAPPV
ncbi:hypothetical protein N7455_006394 [Penicillium solitum]|uniref:C2H2-type domain-containing protein n=1 Tax=Penicillium solitum TaxID=60172 RepID=A0A1V6R1P7_9EURO|nr:uncharacterized protein PENSOL_c021G05801 [Penicillium solitum]KAF4770131.1 hypothetical protein HAV15_011875 [Penicillium sp. str. \